jgi:hypothetical protein
MYQITGGSNRIDLVVLQQQKSLEAMTTKLVLAD